MLECVDPKSSVNAPVGIIKGNGSDIRDIRINFIRYDSFERHFDFVSFINKK